MWFPEDQGKESVLQGRLGRHDLDCSNVTRKPKFIIREGVEREILKKRELEHGCQGDWRPFCLYFCP